MASAAACFYAQRFAKRTARSTATGALSRTYASAGNGLSAALADLMAADTYLADIHKLYECHDRLLEHKFAVFDHLVARWRDLFNVSFDVLLYDLTSTYFGRSAVS